jgi:release factor glutamine methyltransferase
MTIHEARQRLVFQLYDIYDNREAVNIADLIMEHSTGWKKIDLILNKRLRLLPDKLELIEKYTRELLAHRPVQYVLNEAWFHGLMFHVNEHVLIPRPETEELVQWVKTAIGRAQNKDLKMLDIGTGSGCISIALKKQLPFAAVCACDISKDALEVAQRNANMHKTDIGWLHTNFLDSAQWKQLPSFDIIVSNPPYIPVKDKENMRANVLQYEPHIALFVENDDPLIFYRAMADFAKVNMRPGGRIYAEIHEDLSNEVNQLFAMKGFNNIELKKDMQGKDRMIRVTI